MADEPTITEPVDPAPVDPVDPPVDPVDPQDPPEEPKFNKAQLQQLSSIMGNMIKKTVEDTVTPLLNTRQVNPLSDDTAPNNPALAQFNEKLQEKIFSGDVVGAFQDFLSVNDRANKNLSQQQQTDLNKVISKYDEKPYYKDVFPDFEKRAKDLVSKKGYPVEAAAELAYQTSVSAHLVNAQKPHGNLDMTIGGKRTFSKETGKLPEQFEKAYQRDKAKGLFKDRKDYVESLSPQVRAQYEI